MALMALVRTRTVTRVLNPQRRLPWFRSRVAQRRTRLRYTFDIRAYFSFPIVKFLFAKRNVTPPSGQALVPTNLDDLDVEEPSDDILMRTLADGIANGTILLSDSDSEDLEDTSKIIYVL